MNDLRTAAKAVIETWDEHGVIACIVHIEALRQALAAPESSVDALIAEAVATEREACAQIAMDFWCDAGAVAIRARGQK